MNLIAETAWHHDGDFDFFKNLVTKLVAETNADYIKLHITLNLDEYMHFDHPAYEWAKNRIFTKSQWVEIISIINQGNKKTMMLFNDTEAIDFGMKFNTDLVEIHSVCLNDIHLLTHLRSRINENTKIVLGVGGSSLYEIENAIALLSTDNIVLMHGFQNYPTKYEDINFSKIRKLMKLYPKYDHGYADHTAWDNENNLLVTIIGASLGMKYIEKHVTTHVGEGRTDWQAAIPLKMFKELEVKLKVLNESNGDGLLRLNQGEQSYSTFGKMKKAAILIVDKYPGEKVELIDFIFKRTGQVSDLSQLDIQSILGRQINLELKKGQCLNKKYFE